MRILFLQAFPLWGCGSGTYTRSLAQELAQRKGNEVAILTPESKIEKKARKVPKVRTYPLELPFPAVFLSHPEWPVARKYDELSPKEVADIFKSFLQGTIKAVEDFKPDILHVQHLSLLLWVANFINALFGTNFIVTSHGTGVAAALVNKAYVPLSQDALRRAERIICVSKDNKERLLKTFGEEFREKTRIIPGGINLDKFPEEKKITIIDKKYDLNDKKIVLFTGKLTSEKGIEYLVKAAKDIKGDVFIIGDGPELNKSKELASKLKIENIHFLGYMGKEQEKELEEFYYRADVFVAPSVVAEALGLTILEAMAAATPVVATRKGGISLAVKNGINGFLVRAKSSKQIAESVNKILLDDVLRKKMSQNSREIVKKKFIWGKIALKFHYLYKKAKKNEKAKNGKNNKKNK